MSAESEIRALRADLSEMRAKLAALTVLVEHYGLSTRNIEAMALDTARETGAQQADIDEAKKAIRYIQAMLSGADGIGARLRVVEELFRRKSVPTPQGATPAPAAGELATLEIKKTEAWAKAFVTALPAVIKALLVGGVGAGLVKAIDWLKEAIHK